MQERIFIALDLETTGVDPEKDQIIEVGLVRCTTENILDTYKTLVRPTVDISSMSSMLTQISSEELASAPLWQEVEHTVQNFIGPLPIIGHSVSFDVSFLNKAGIHLSKTHYDTYDFAQILTYGTPSYKLAYLADACGIVRGTHHRALDDALMTAKLFQHFIKELQLLPEELRRQLSFLSTYHNQTPWFLPNFLPKVSDTTETPDRYFFMSRYTPESLKREYPERTVDPKKLLSLPDLLPNVFTSHFQQLLQHDGQQHAIKTVERQDDYVPELVLVAMYKSVQSNAPSVIAYASPRQKASYTQAIKIIQENTGSTLSSVLYSAEDAFFCPVRFSQFLFDRENVSQEKLVFLAKILHWLFKTTSWHRKELRLRGDMQKMWEDIAVRHSLWKLFTPKEKDMSPYTRHRESLQNATLLMVQHRDSLNLLESAMDIGFFAIDEIERLSLHFGQMQSTLTAVSSISSLLLTLLGMGKAGALIEKNDQLPLFQEQQQATHKVLGLLPQIHVTCRRIQTDTTAVLIEQITACEKAGMAFLSAWQEWSREFSAALTLIIEDNQTTPIHRKKSSLASIKESSIWKRTESYYRVVSTAATVLFPTITTLCHELLTRVADTGRQEALQLLALSEQLEQSLTHIDQCYSDQKQEICWFEQSKNGWSIGTTPSTAEALIQKLPPSSLLLGSQLSIEGNVSLFSDLLGTTLTLIDFVHCPLPLTVDHASPQVIEGKILQMLQQRSGSVLLLFPSGTQLQEYYQGVFENYSKLGIPCFVQQITHNIAQLQKAITEQKLGLYMMTIDSCTAIEQIPHLKTCFVMKVPFPYPGDLVYQERTRQYADGFNDYTIPFTALRIRQICREASKLFPDLSLAKIIVWDERFETMGYGERLGQLVSKP